MNIEEFENLLRKKYTISSTPVSRSYLFPDGTFLALDSFNSHQGVQQWLIDNGYVKDSDELHDGGCPTLEDLGAMRINLLDEGFIMLSQVPPTEVQYIALSELLDKRMHSTWKWRDGILIIEPHQKENFKEFNTNGKDSDYIIGIIRHYYETGHLTEPMGEAKGKTEIDNKGNELSLEQSEFFKHSEVREGANDNLIVCYHGTRSSSMFDVFDTSGGRLTWFSEDKGYANGFTNYGEDNNVFSVYLNITHMLDVGELDVRWAGRGGKMPSQELKMLSDSLGVNVSVLLDIANNDHVFGENISAITSSKEFATLLKQKGYDGVVATESGEFTFGVLNSSQIKSVSNKNPTYSDNINEAKMTTNAKSELNSAHNDIGNNYNHSSFPERGPMYIDKDGFFVSVDETHFDFWKSVYQDIHADSDDNYDEIQSLMDSAEEDGMIRVNDGTMPEDDKAYIVIMKAPTQSQYTAIEKWFDSLKKKNVILYTYPEGDSREDSFNIDVSDSKQAVKSIKRYFVSGFLEAKRCALNNKLCENADKDVYNYLYRFEKDDMTEPEALPKDFGYITPEGLFVNLDSEQYVDHTCFWQTMYDDIKDEQSKSDELTSTLKWLDSHDIDDGIKLLTYFEDKGWIRFNEGVNGSEVRTYMFFSTRPNSAQIKASEDWMLKAVSDGKSTIQICCGRRTELDSACVTYHVDKDTSPEYIMKRVMMYYSTGKLLESNEFNMSKDKVDYMKKDHYFNNFTMKSVPLAQLVKDNNLDNNDELSYHDEWASRDDENGNPVFDIKSFTYDKNKDTHSGDIIYGIEKNGKIKIANGKHRIRALANDGYTSIMMPIYSESCNESDSKFVKPLEVEGQSAYLLYKFPSYESKPKDGFIRLYHQTSSNNLLSILKDGKIKADVWAQASINQNQWYYGGLAICFDCPKDKAHARNDEDYTIFDDVPSDWFKAIVSKSDLEMTKLIDRRNPVALRKELRDVLNSYGGEAFGGLVGESLDESEDDFNWGTGKVVGDNIFDTSTLGGFTYYADTIPGTEYHQYMIDKKNREGKIVQMSPNEYYKNVADRIFHTTVDDLKQQRTAIPGHIDKLKKVITDKKEQFPMCFIDYPDQEQEGLHRMYVAGELFGWDHKFPVLVINIAKPIEQKNVNEDTEVSKDIGKALVDFFGTTDTIPDGPAWIIDNGKFLTLDNQSTYTAKYYVDPKYKDEEMTESAMHGCETRYLLDKGVIKDKSEFGEYADKHAWVQTNTTRPEEEQVIRLSYNEPNSAQYKSIASAVDYYLNGEGYVKVDVNAWNSSGLYANIQTNNYSETYHDYVLWNNGHQEEDRYTTVSDHINSEYVVNRIKGYYKTGALTESKNVAKFDSGMTCLDAMYALKHEID
jgi:predicted Fe-Mo cluster-binding NifX family protein